MPATRMSAADVARAQQLWDEYQKQHDLSDRKGQAAGIDPVSGRVWFGNGLAEIVRQLQAEGLDNPVFLARVGYPTYYRKGGRR